MEKLTNDYWKMIGAVKRELAIQPGSADGKRLLFYSQIPSFPGDQLSFFLFTNGYKTYTLIKKAWDHKYDLERFSSHVYNLGRLCIKTIPVELSANHQQQCNDLLAAIEKLPETLEQKDYILLDGVDYEMKIQFDNKEQSYNWRVPTEDINTFTPLLDFLFKISED